MFTPALCRTARSLLAWSRADLAAAAGVARSTVADWERNYHQLIPNNLAALKAALERGGVRFLAEAEGGLVLERRPSAPPPRATSCSPPAAPRRKIFRL